MNKEQHEQFMKDQIHEIEVYKWCESEKAQRDLGQEAVKDWIRLFAKQFREKWEEEKKKNNK